MEFWGGVADVEGCCAAVVAAAVVGGVDVVAVGGDGLGLVRGGVEEIWDVAGPGGEVGVGWFGAWVGFGDDVAGEDWWVLDRAVENRIEMDGDGERRGEGTNLGMKHLMCRRILRCRSSL